jgi:quinol monooxygenase YgiN
MSPLLAEETMIIVAGKISVAAHRRDAFVAASLEAVTAARQTPGCLDFVVAADPIDVDRVNVYERWASRQALETFRGDGPGPDLTEDILTADVRQFQADEDTS